MKQLVLLSGKGGTGKTCIAAAFANLTAQSGLTNQIVLVDADVDASNLAILVQPTIQYEQEFSGGKLAVIDQNACSSCGDCQAICRFDAIDNNNGLYTVDPFACDGCAACVYQCPNEAIRMHEQLAGKYYFSESSYGPLYHAELFPGQENSGKLVTLVKQQARLKAGQENRRLVIVDGPPGIGCPVISAVSGADLALIVTEPSLAGIQDMQRVLKTGRHFGVRSMVCINKADIYPEGAQWIEKYCHNNRIEIVGGIPFDLSVASAMAVGQPVTAYLPQAPASIAISEIWNKVIDSLIG